MAYGTVLQLPHVAEQKEPATPAVAQHATSDSDVVPVSVNAVRAGKVRLLQEMKDLDDDLSTGELVRSVLNIAWEYLTLVDEKKTFALPVSSLFFLSLFLSLFLHLLGLFTAGLIAAIILQMSDRIAPGYSKIIQKKMDLSSMKTKIYRGDYSTIEDFQDDVQLIADNCRKFNAGAEEFVKVSVF